MNDDQNFKNYQIFLRGGPTPPFLILTRMKKELRYFWG